MTRSTQTAEFNTFVKGLITEASPLTFPENASLDEANFILNKDGTRQRRLGLDYEEDFVELDSGVIPVVGSQVITNIFLWKNAGGITSKSFTVLQVGSTMFFFDTAAKPLSSGLVYTYNGGISARNTRASFAAVDKSLVVVNGLPEITTFSYDDRLGTISETASKILIRDTFGVADKDGAGLDLLQGQGLVKRPEEPLPAHIYNLRNQSFGSPRSQWPGNEVRIADPIEQFYDTTLFRYGDNLARYFPSNADTVVYSLSPLPAADDNVSLRFNEKSLIVNSPGTFRAATGFFVIDLLSRGKSRVEEMAKLHEENSFFKYAVTSLPQDYTADGPKAVTEYAGRVWYAGFSADVTDGDSQSPNLASYVAYSKLVQVESDVNKCYQDGDPTSDTNQDLLETDGGFIRLDGAYNIQEMVAAADSLFVLAENGVWKVSGGSTKGFTATSNVVSKITEHGSIGANSAVLVDGTLMYWSDDAIQHIAPDKFGDWSATDISINIKGYYANISEEDKAYCIGIYDHYDNVVRWLYGNRFDPSQGSRELVLDTKLQAFYPSIIPNVSGGVPFPNIPIETPAYVAGSIVQDVIYGADDVVYQGSRVRVDSTVRKVGLRSTAYFVATAVNPTAKFTVALYRDPTFRDWYSHDNVGVDAPAHLLSGYIGNGDFMRHKQVPYIYFHLNRTETGWEETEEGLVPEGESSCIVQAQWDWTNSPASGRWSTPFQAYRYKRPYLPEDANDPYDVGQRTIVSKSKLRGRGRVVSLLIESEPYKDMQLLGWSMMLGSTSNV